MSILIVDDSPPVVSLMRATLGRAGYEGTVCKDCGPAALSYLGIDPSGASLPEIDCVLLDIGMPGMDGIEVCRRIKAHPAYADTPVIMVTIRDEAEILYEAFTAGAHDFISKPVRELELLARLKAAIFMKQEIAARRALEAEVIRLKGQLAEANDLLSELRIKPTS